ncbi:MAG: glycosyltransferase family 4 protein [Gemmatimonadota bacterium]
MKIAIVSPRVLGALGTPSTYSSQQLNLARCWAEDGHSVDLITMKGQELERACLGPGVRLHLLSGIALGGIRLALMWATKDILRGDDYDFVLASEHYQPETAAACIQSSRVLIYQGQNWPGASFKNRTALRLLEASVGRVTRERCMGVIAKTRRARDFLAERGFAPIRVIPCGYDDSRFFPPSPKQRAEARDALGASVGEMVMVYAGNLVKRRDVASAVRAVGLLARQGRRVRLLVVGDGPEGPRLRSLAASLHLRKDVAFTGVLPWSRLRQVFWAGDVFVFPAHYEIFGLVVLEAMACGLAVLSTPVGGAADLLRDGENGTFIPPGDPAALADRITSLLDAPDHLEAIRHAARREVRHLTWKTVAGRFINQVRADFS